MTSLFSECLTDTLKAEHLSASGQADRQGDEEALHVAEDYEGIPCDARE